MRGLVVLALVGCGRIGFDATGDGGTTAAGRWRLVSAGDISTCAITTEDELFCWGNGEQGQLGNGSVAIAQAPTRVDGDWKTVSIAGFHACGVKTDHTLWCWGLNQSGAIGAGATNSRQQTPVKISDALFATVSTGEKFSCAIDKTDALWCWGSNANGQLGDGSGMDRGAPTVIGEATWSQISLGQSHACGIQTDDSLWCWGSGAFGQLGNGTAGQTSLPMLIAPGKTWAAVQASVVHTCAIETTGDVWCWGDNSSGMIGDGTYQRALLPKRTSVVKAQSIGVGTHHTCAIDVNDDVWCWGGTTRGEFGVEISDDVLTPTKIEQTAEAIDGGGTLTCTIGGGGKLFCAGANHFGQTGQPFGEVHDPVRADDRTDWASVFASRRHACAITRGNAQEVWCWGDGYAGQVGDGGNYDRQTPKLAGSGFTTLALGEPTTAGIKTDQSMWVWGENIDNMNHLTPTQIQAMTSAVAVGDAHGCRLSGTTLRCGGYNTRGQVGDGTTTDRTAPITIAGTWTNVWAGFDTTCAMAQANGLFCWGQGDSGQLGNGTTTDASTPQAVALADIAIVRIGLDFACALRGTDGSLWCWGEAPFGQFGNGTPGTSNVPVQVQPGMAVQWSRLAVGDWHVCAITNTSDLYCWGHGDEGQLGDSALVQRNAPRLVSGGWADVAAGDHFTCAIKLDGTRWCFGANGDGQLGNGRAWHATFLQVP